MITGFIDIWVNFHYLSLVYLVRIFKNVLACDLKSIVIFMTFLLNYRPFQHSWGCIHHHLTVMYVFTTMSSIISCTFMGLLHTIFIFVLRFISFLLILYSVIPILYTPRYFVFCFRCQIIISGILPRAYNRFKNDTSAQDSFLDSANRRSADLNESLRRVSLSFPRVMFADHSN